jgi:hypothetical protein
LFILFNSIALLLFSNHNKDVKPKIKLNTPLDSNILELLKAFIKNSYTVSAVGLSALILLLALNIEPIGLKKIIIENGIVINPKLDIFKSSENHIYFELHGKKALIIKDRSSLKKLNGLLSDIREVDILLLPKLNSRDIYLDRIIELLNPQFTISSYKKSKDNHEKLQKNILLISQHSNSIMNSGVIYISEDKFWSLKN